MSDQYDDGFYDGQQSKQAEVEELQNKYDAMYRAFTVADDCRKEWHRCYVSIRQREDELQKRVKELELINFDSELHFDAAKEHIDNLQKRIDEISNHVEINYDENRDDDSHSYWSGYNQALRELFEILKGE